jgi:hypothetical protein
MMDDPVHSSVVVSDEDIQMCDDIRRNTEMTGLARDE